MGIWVMHNTNTCTHLVADVTQSQCVCIYAEMPCLMMPFDVEVYLSCLCCEVVCSKLLWFLFKCSLHFCIHSTSIDFICLCSNTLHSCFLVFKNKTEKIKNNGKKSSTLLPSTH